MGSGEIVWSSQPAMTIIRPPRAKNGERSAVLALYQSPSCFANSITDCQCFADLRFMRCPRYVPTAKPCVRHLPSTQNGV